MGKANTVRSKDTSAWILHSWLSFFLAISITGIGIVFLSSDNIDLWRRGFLGMGLTYSIGASFNLAKTIRDNHEAESITAKIEEAKVEKLLAEHNTFKATI
jgi:hypothetical protein